MSAFEFPASQTSVSLDVAVVQEIFKRLDKLDAKIEATNDKIDAVNADLSAKINHILVRMDEHNARIATLEERKEEEAPVPCIPSQGPFFLLRAYYVWFADAPSCRHLKSS
jgi:hypothetical protein